VILGFGTAEKTPQDVITVSCDWTPFLALCTPGASSITAHSVAVDTEIAGIEVGGFGDFLAIGNAGVIATDNGVAGLLHGVTLTGGMLWAYSVVALSVTFNDGTQLTRGFQVNVR
jgi:hypothetical protein